MRIIHQQWRLVGLISVVDDEGNAVNLNLENTGQVAKSGTIEVPVNRFRGNEFVDAYNRARQLCDETLAKYEAPPAPYPEAELKAPADLEAAPPAAALEHTTPN